MMILMLAKGYKTSIGVPKLRRSVRRRPTVAKALLASPCLEPARKLRETRTIGTSKAVYEGRLIDGIGKDRAYAIVVARFNELVTKSLLQGALAGFAAFDVKEDDLDVYWVPGSFELPVVARRLASGGRYSAVVCIGAIIRGGTSHYDAVVQAATSGVLRASMDTNKPVIFGVLTCDDTEQAMERAGGKMGNKGYEAAVSAIEMADLMTKLPH